MASTPVRVLITTYIASMAVLCLGFGFLCQITTYVLFLPFILSSEQFRSKALGFSFKSPLILAAKYINPFWRFKVIKPMTKKSRRMIVMTNHLNSTDPLFLSAAMYPMETKYVHKADLLKVPFFGWSMALSGELPVQFTKEKDGWGTLPGSVSKMMERAKQLVNLGICPAVYPEGTRSRLGRLQPFKDGFFRFAVENDVDILPVAIFGQQNAMPLSSLKLLDTAQIDVMFGEPISPNGHTPSSLKHQIREKIIELTKLSPQYDPKLHEPLDENAPLQKRGTAK